MTISLNEQAGKLLIAVIEKHKCDAAMAAARKAGQFLLELWSVKATRSRPFRAAIPAILAGVISSSPQGDRQE